MKSNIGTKENPMTKYPEWQPYCSRGQLSGCPSKDRYQRPVFEIFFREAIQSKAAFLVYDIKTAEFLKGAFQLLSGMVIGTSRFYDINEADESITIGYTFLARAYWGNTNNLENHNHEN